MQNDKRIRCECGQVDTVDVDADLAKQICVGCKRYDTQLTEISEAEFADAYAEHRRQMRHACGI